MGKRCGLGTLGVLPTALSCLLLAACSVPTDQEYGQPATDPPFVLTAVVLPAPLDQPQPVNPTIMLTLSDLPDPATVQFPALQLGPRSQSVEFGVEISLVDRQLTLRPKRQLLPENDYFIRLSQNLRALSGRQLEQPVSVRFHTGSFVQPMPMAQRPVTLQEILADDIGLRARCATDGCHGSRSPAQGLDFSLPTAVLQARLTSQPARGSLEGLLLVQPGVPEQSYLLRKLIGGVGFSRISGAPMPPAGLPPVDKARLRAVERWIAQGAR